MTDNERIERLSFKLALMTRAFAGHHPDGLTYGELSRWADRKADAEFGPQGDDRPASVRMAEARDVDDDATFDYLQDRYGGEGH